MSTVTRGTKSAGGTSFTAHSDALSAELNTDLDNLVDAHNNHDSGALTWTATKATTLTAVTTFNIGVNAFAYTPWTAYTPTISAGVGTATVINFFYKQMGDSLFVRGSFKCGTVAASEANFTLPAGKTIATTKIPATTASTAIVGRWILSKSELISSNDDEGTIFSDGSTTGTIYFNGTGSAGNGLVKANGDAFAQSNSYVMVQFEVAIS